MHVIAAHNWDEGLRGLPRVVRATLAAVGPLDAGTLLVRLPDGTALQLEGQRPGPAGDVTVHDWRVFRRVLLRGDVGLGEAFMAGEWDSPDPTAMLEVFAENSRHTEAAFSAGFWGRIVLGARALLHQNTRRGSRRNIAAHYDLGNDFYAAWLDPSMTYSAADYSRGANDLEGAQRDKFRALAEATGIKPGDDVLEIGCGWGGFSIFAARELGCRVTALTISKAQKAFAEARIRAEGLEDRISVALRDYRDERGRYDKIVSIEMFEAVGERYWPHFFATLSSCLKPGGVAGLQIITVRDEFFEAYRKGTDFLQTYIFPGGMLPSMGKLTALGRDAALDEGSARSLGLDYARTLGEWRARFDVAWPTLAGTGFDERFRRMWLFYLHFCEAGFARGLTDVKQLTFAKPER